ncbi:MAG TPA: class I SAM-dependent methyltransferase [Anaerolineales bacterium]|nr:class I SAM-dependent methyltransferase [Anaerolineales bacterium]
MPLNKQQVRDLYAKRAERYDLGLNFYRLLGFRLDRYRQLAVQSLALQAGDTVIDLACGTGLNFKYLQRAVGEQGRIIGVDLTEAMLDQARQRLTVNGWHNVHLIQADLAEYSFPAGVAGILSSYAITLVPEFDGVIQRGARALQHGGRMAILDFKKPDHWPEWLIRLGAWLYKPYGVSLDLAVRHPWESVDRYLHQIVFREFYFGGLYLSVGERRA